MRLSHVSVDGEMDRENLMYTQGGKLFRFKICDNIYGIGEYYVM